jgi:hypothetical protein
LVDLRRDPYVRKPSRSLGGGVDVGVGTEDPWDVRLCFILLLIGAGCAAMKDAAVPLVRVHANKDLRCPDDKISVEPLIGGRYVASGCGRRAEYHSACDGLQCSVGREGEDPNAWRDRPEPGSLESLR